MIKGLGGTPNRLQALDITPTAQDKADYPQ
jgi:hypothetical protein